MAHFRLNFARLVVILLLQSPGEMAGLQAVPRGIGGVIRDSSGGVIPGARLTLRHRGSGAETVTLADSRGEFSFPEVPHGDYDLVITAPGFARVEQIVEHDGNGKAIQVQLAPAAFAQTLLVTASRVRGTSEDLQRLPGSFDLIDASVLAESRSFTIDEALRKVPGLLLRGEEGFGLRPNIGVRGLNPTRSTQVLLLEDGLPLAFAPYGDNASYYHPPIDRFSGAEVVKGGGQIAYGPRTVGAVLNYLTPAPPEKWSGDLLLTGGNRDYYGGHLAFGGTAGNTGVLFDVLRKQGRGSRANLRHGVNDFNAKTLTTLSPTQTLSLRFSAYSEDSQVTYSGLRQSEYDASPHDNPFSNDSFESLRFGTSVRHSWALREDFVISTAAYGTTFARDWWRQSSNSGQRPNDSADPACGGMANLHTTCGNEGRLRDYYTFGVESKARATFSWLGVRHESDFGIRWHLENQKRRQENGPLPDSRSGVLVEDNLRDARAFSFFGQDSIVLGRWRVTPGVRVENIHYERTNRLGNAGAGVEGSDDMLVAIPGFGVSYNPSDELTFFAGIHRGFAPPRVEDAINNNTGASVNLEPELSWNFEAGARILLANAFRIEATYFRMDFENQIVPTSVAGGVGATLTNGGETLHQGLELGWRYDWRSAFGTGNGLYLRGAYTWLPTAEFTGQRFSGVSGFSTVLVTGNRLPYAAENLLTASIGWMHRRGMNAQLESVYTGRQFGDDLNTIPGTPDGQRGLIPGNVIWNFTANYPVEGIRSTFFLSVKNLFDRTAIVDRTRGLLPNSPRLVQAGLRWNF